MHRVAAFLAIVLLSACLSGQAYAETFVVGVGLGLTGPSADLARDCRDGLALWADDVNAHGGILGHDVELAVIDHGGDPLRIAEAYDELAAEGGADWLLAPADDDAALVAAETAARHGLPMLAGAATADALWADGPGRVPARIVGVLTPASRQLTDFLAMLVLAGADRLALVGGQGAYAEAACRGALTWAKRFGMDVVLFEQPALGGWDDVAKRARRSGAQALAVCCRTDEAEAAVLAVRGLGWAPMALLATMGPCLDGFGARLGLAAEGVFSVSTWEYDPALANVADFESRFEGRFGRRPSWVAAAAYACGEILVRAARRAGNLDREAMFQAMHSLDMMTVAGRFAVDDQGRQIRQIPVVLQWQDGRTHVVWPPAYARTGARLSP